MNASRDFAVAVERIDFAFSRRNGRPEERIFHDFSLVVPAGSTMALMGPSGVGKSTLGALIAGHFQPRRGRVRYGTLIQRPADVVYVDQSPLNAVFPWQTVAGNLDYPLRKLGWSGENRTERARRLLKLFGLTDLAASFPANLSGGELQRLALARSLSWRPRLAVLDEAFGALDVHTRQASIEALRAIAGEDEITVVAITHSIADAMTLAGWWVVLSGRPARVAFEFDAGNVGLSDATVEDHLMEAIRHGQI